jgi:hypothetical protein
MHEHEKKIEIDKGEAERQGRKALIIRINNKK